jgi:hypothetical protein
MNFKLNSKFLFLTLTTLLYLFIETIPSIIYHTYYYFHYLSIHFLLGFLLPIKVLLFAILHLQEVYIFVVLCERACDSSLSLVFLASLAALSSSMLLVFKMKREPKFRNLNAGNLGFWFWLRLLEFRPWGAENLVLLLGLRSWKDLVLLLEFEV